jgi:hypothetical protein
MSLAELTITLDIQNNTNYSQTINVLGNPYNLLDTVNSKTEYRWNVTGVSLTTENYLSLQYRGINQSVFTAYISGFGTNTLQSVVNSLNDLQIGYFNLYTELGQTYIGTYNSNYVFGQLNIYNASFGTVTLTNYTTANPLFSQLGYITYAPPALPTVSNVNAGDGAIIFDSWDGTSIPVISFELVTNIVGTANSYVEVIKNGVIVYSNFGTTFAYPITTLTPPDQYLINWYDVAP